jgi:hypothetical protein
MTEATKAALEDVEPVDPDHYFAGVYHKGSPFSGKPELIYGLVEAQFPDESAPLDADTTRVVVAEDVNADSLNARPVLTVMFREVDGIEEVDTEDEGARAEILLNKVDDFGGALPNQVAKNPIEARAIITKAMKKHHLARVITTPEDVQGIPSERHLNAASFLVEAGFNKVGESEGSDTYELLRKPDDTPAPESKTPELIAA